MAKRLEDRLKRSHVLLMRHPETAFYSGIFMMGKSRIADDNCPTAYTDGIDKVYGREFCSKLTDAEFRGLIMHENLHVALKHMSRFKALFKDDAELVNASADYVVNDIIMSFEDKEHCHLPEGGLYDAKYHNWSVNQVIRDLKKQQEEGKQPNLETLDDHGFGDSEGSGEGGQGDGDSQDAHGKPKPMTGEEQKAFDKEVDKALREGKLIAGRFGNKTPRAIDDTLAPRIDWKAVLKDFVMSVTKGAEEYTWRRFNKRYLADDIYLPSTENDTVGELVVAIDTSGSIGSRELNSFASEVASICETCTPDKVRILWWDTQVHGEQIFTSDYQDIVKLLKPQGGGGTEAQCIADYINEKKINAEGVIVFTDGYFWDTPRWDIDTKTLWVVTDTEQYVPSSGTVVKQDYV